MKVGKQKLLLLSFAQIFFMVTVYAIPNCDTMKKAMKWLESNGIGFVFHDYKKQGIATKKLHAWSQEKGWENLLNKKSATWREVDEATKATTTNEKNAVKLMHEKTSIIKRPVIERNDKLVVIGFDEAMYTAVFK